MIHITKWNNTENLANEVCKDRLNKLRYCGEKIIINLLYIKIK